MYWAAELMSMAQHFLNDLDGIPSTAQDHRAGGSLM
jgi:hypothetical protein